MALDGLPLAANPFELFEVPMVSGPDSVTIRAPLSRIAASSARLLAVTSDDQPAANSQLAARIHAAVVSVLAAQRVLHPAGCMEQRQHHFIDNLDDHLVGYWTAVDQEVKAHDPQTGL
jgi:hypothetical protein